VIANTVFGVLGALTIVRGRFRGRALLEAVIDLPFAVSPVVIGLSLVLISPKLGLSAVTPLTSDGMRMLPRPSEPSVTGTVRVATAIALPLLEPPGVNLRSQGLTPQVPQASSPQCSHGRGRREDTPGAPGPDGRCLADV